MRKRILSFLLALLMVVSILPMPTYAEDTPNVAITPTETPSGAVIESPCGTCGQYACTSDHLTWCADCKVDNCGQTHVFCGTCQKNDCGVDHNAELPRVPMTSTGPTASINEDETPHPMVGKVVTLVAEPGMLTAIENPKVSTIGNIVGVRAYPEHMEIEAVETVGNYTYYQLKAAEGKTWPDYFGTIYEHYWLPSTQVEEVKSACPVCGEPDCTTEHKQCEICGGYDCIKIHFWCEHCEKYDCGKSHLICPVPDCGNVDCTEAHTFCPHCGIYDCGIEHEDEFKPNTAPVIPENPILTPGVDVSIVDEYGDAVTEDGLFLEDGTKTSISAWPAGEADGYQWQICYNNANDLWADIQGETGKGILISPAMFLNIIDYQGTTSIRCVVTGGEEVQISASIPVTVIEAVPQQEMMMFSTRPDARDAAPVADVEYSIVIDYKFRDGTKAATSWTASLAQGADYILDVESPAVVGYKPDQARITETITNFTGTRIITVYYDPDIVEFKVIHHQQNITGNEYTPYRTDTKQGYTGTQVGADLQASFDGFDQLNYDETLVIAADGSTVVNIYYDREYFIVHLDLNGGYSAEPICARYGTPVSIADPQRTGYSFAGWSPALPAFIEKETSHTAQWTKANTGFTVAFWYENANDEEYTFVGSVQQTATTGSKVNGANYKDIAFDDRDNDHFTFEKADTNVEIAADGSTVVNVYFSRNTYTLTYYKWKCLHTHTNACCSLQHIHNQPAGACCSLHVHTISNCIDGAIGKVTDENNSQKCYAQYPNPVNGQTCTVDGFLGIDMHFVYFDGSWYRRNAGNTFNITWKSACPRTAPHAHGSGCNTSKCGITAHDHSSGRLSTCNNSACTHKAAFQCETDISNMNHWPVSYQGIFKYEQDVSAVHAAQGAERWCPGHCEGLKDAEGNYYASYGQSPAHGVYSSMGGGDVTFFQGSVGSVQYYLTYWLETNDGSGTRTVNGHNFVQGATSTPKMGAVGYQGDYIPGIPVGFEAFEAWASNSLAGDNVKQLSEGQQFGGSEYVHYNFYYTRQTFTLSYFNGSTQVATHTMKYDEPLTSTYNLQNLSMTSPYGSGYYFAGWYLDPECTIPVSWGSTRMPDGGLAVYAKWAPTTHTVTTYQTKGGTKLNTYNVIHGEAYSGTVNKPTNGVLNFVGWFYEEDGEKKAYDFSMPVYKDMELYAEWTSDVQVTGIITYIDRATGKELARFSPISGQVGATKTYEAKVGIQLDYTGYFPEVTSHNIEFSANESQNNWIFYYNAMKDVPYEVRYINGATGAAMAEPDRGITNEPTLTFKAKTFKGYSADAYEKTLIVSSDETLNVIVFSYSEDTVHAPVQVVHYIQNTTGNGYTRYLTEEAYQGTIGQVQTKIPLAIDGFTYNQTRSKNGIELTEDGLQLELYYDRNTYNYKFCFEDTAGNILRDPVEGSGLYGSLAEYTTQSIPGYRLTTPGTLTVTIGTNASSNVKTFVYEERTVTIRYEVGAVKGGSVTNPSESFLAVNGTPDGSEAKTNTNYTFVGWYTDYACTEANKVGNDETFIPQRTADGVYVDDVYYAKFEEVKVTLHYSVDMPDNAAEEATLTKTSEQVSIYTGRATGSSVDVIPNGYQFDGWYDADGNKLAGSTTYTPPRTDSPWEDGTTYYARFIEKKVTITYVAVGNGTVSSETEEVNMVTGTAAGTTATATKNIAQFVGWYDNAACEGDPLSKEASFTPIRPDTGWAETNTYYAKFEDIEYTITFENLGEVIATESYHYGDDLTLPDITNGNYLVTWTVKDTSGSWTKDTEVENGIINHYGNVTLEANWTIHVVWVDWNFNIISPDEDALLHLDKNVPYGVEHIYDGPELTRQADDRYSYKFDGVWEEIELSMLPENLKEDLKGIIIYRACYTQTAVPYTITYHLDGGVLPSGIQNPQTYTVETETFTLPSPSKVGHEFLGWAASATADTGETTVIIEKGSTGNREYYAIWKLALVNLTVTATGIQNDQTYIFTVTRKDDPSFTPIKVILSDSNGFKVTIRDVPVGTYEVKEVNEWSWRQGAIDAQAILLDRNRTLTFGFDPAINPYWLNGYSYNDRKKGGSSNG